jgi:hypothetical protein
VTVKWLRYKAKKKETKEIVYGPYNNDESIDEWGKFHSEFVVQPGGTPDEATAEAYARRIIRRNKVPTIKPKSLAFFVTNARSMAHAVKLDLYSIAKIVYQDKVNRDFRIVGIEHNITPDTWAVALMFGETTAVEQPLRTTPVKNNIVGEPFLSRHRAANQSINNSTWETVLFTDESQPVVNIDYASGVITFDDEGVYIIKAQIQWDGNATGRRAARINVNNGVAIIAQNDIPADTTGPQGDAVMAVFRVDEGDTIRIQAWQNSGGALNIIGSRSDCHVMIYRVGD